LLQYKFGPQGKELKLELKDEFCIFFD